MKKEINPVRQHLEETFKKLLPDKAAPAELKQEVFQTLDALNLPGGSDAQTKKDTPENK